MGNYVATINRSTSASEVWKKVKAIAGKSNYTPIELLQRNGDTMISKEEIAESISSGNYEKGFSKRRVEFEAELNLSIVIMRHLVAQNLIPLWPGLVTQHPAQKIFHMLSYRS